MQKYKLIKNSQTKTFFNREYIKSLLNTKNKTTKIELNTSILKLTTSTFRIILFFFTF